jgi:hypothetical protein
MPHLKTKNRTISNPVLFALSLCWSFCGFFSWSLSDWLFLWLVLAKFVSVLSGDGLLGSLFVPLRQFDTVLLENKCYTARRLCTILKIFLHSLFIKGQSLGSWVIVADLSYNTTRKRVALRFLDDYSIHR